MSLLILLLLPLTFALVGGIQPCSNLQLDGPPCDILKTEHETPSPLNHKVPRAIPSPIQVRVLPESTPNLIANITTSTNSPTISSSAKPFLASNSKNEIPSYLSSSNSELPAKDPMLSSRTPLYLHPLPVQEIQKPTNHEQHRPSAKAPTRRPQRLYDYTCPADGYYTISHECNSYIECKKDMAWMHVCEEGMHFNPSKRWPQNPCDHSSEVKCRGREIPRTTPSVLECPERSGFFPMGDGECSRYIRCLEGRPFIMNCSAGLVFNPELNTCDWLVNVPSCTPNAFSGIECPPPPLDENGDETDELFKFRYSEDCSQYVACQHGKPRLLRCDDGYFFDDESQLCLEEDQVDCELNDDDEVSQEK